MTVSLLLTAVALFTGPDPKRVAEIAARLPEVPAWAGEPYAYNAKKAKRLLKEKLPDCSDELYLLTSKTGNRSRYQSVCFRRLSHLATLAGAVQATDDARYVRRVAEYLEAICAERSWTLPAHDRKLTNFNGTKLTIDLGSSHRALALAGVLSQLGDKLPPAVCERVRAELERRVFALYRATNRDSGDEKACRAHGNWWFAGGNNWNAVCHSCVVRAALAVVEDRNDRAAFVEAAERGGRIFLERGFLDDGYCTEGMGYWNYGYGHFLDLALALRKATDGFVDFSRLPRAKKPMEYACGYTLDGKKCPVFADGGGGCAREDILDVAQVFWPEFKDFSKRSLPPRTVFPNAQVYIARASRLAIGFKGGHNAELHNHNDVGSWSLLADGKLIAGDPGGEVYTARTFSKDRYVSDVLNSYGHPVPLVGGEKQLVGGASRAQLVAEQFTDDRDMVALDISEAYAATRGKKGAVIREVTFDRSAQAVAITDRFHVESPLSFESAVITPGAECPLVPEVTGGAWRREEKVLENPGKTAPHRHAVVFDAPVKEAAVSWRFAIGN